MMTMSLLCLHLLLMDELHHQKMYQRLDYKSKNIHERLCFLTKNFPSGENLQIWLLWRNNSEKFMSNSKKQNAILSIVCSNTQQQIQFIHCYQQVSTRDIRHFIERKKKASFLHLSVVDLHITLISRRKNVPYCLIIILLIASQVV